MTPKKVAVDYDLHVAQVRAALAYYAEHHTEIDTAIEYEPALERAANGIVG